MKLLTMAKGADFAAGFDRLMGLLEKLASMGEAFAHLKNKRPEILATIGGKIRATVQDKLRENLAEKLYATVTVVDTIFKSGSSASAALDKINAS